MKPALTTLKPSDSILDAIRVFLSAGVRHAPVVEKGKLVGVVSEWDLLRAVARDKVKSLEVRDVMTANAHTVAPDQHYMLLAGRLVDERISCLPVVRDERVVGMITIADVLGAAEREHGGVRRAKSAKKVTVKSRSPR